MLFSGRKPAKSNSSISRMIAVCGEIRIKAIRNGVDARTEVTFECAMKPTLTASLPCVAHALAYSR